MNVKTSLFLVAILGSWTVAQAQQGESLDIGLQKETVRVAPVPQATPAGDRILILNSNTSDTATAASTQNLPTTYVEASPLNESRAEQIRKARRDAEINTEQKIVEKLEHSRLEDERRRAERLFGDRWSKLNDEPKVAEAAPVEVAPVAVAPMVKPVEVIPVEVVPVETVPVAATPSVDEKEEMKNEIMQEIRNDMNATTSTEAEDVEAKESSKTLYVSGQLGNADYPGVYNIEPEFATRLAVGGELSGGVVLEASYMYSQYFIEESYWRYRDSFWKQMDQHNFELAAKYVIFKGMIQPSVGGVASYTVREYTAPGTAWDRNNYDYEDGSSKAFDLGLVLGLDFKLSESFALGADFRYMRNLTNDRNSDYLSSRYYSDENEEPVERLGYQSFTISGKVFF